MRARVAPNHVASRAQFSNLIYREDRKSTRLNSSHRTISYAVFCLKKKTRETRSCPVVGSSRKKILGLFTKPRAISRRRGVPADQVVVCAPRDLVRATTPRISSRAL